MKKILVAIVAVAAIAAVAEETVQIKMKLPTPVTTGTPKEIKSENLEPDPGPGKLRDPIMVPAGYDKLLSADKPCIGSQAEPVTGEYEYLVDGDKEKDVTSMVQLPSGLQWVQVDLEAEHEISACCVWHDQGDERVYHDVICQISNDKDFKTGVTTVFNNDHDDSAKLGKGTDKEYRERNEGRPFKVNMVKGRYVRFYSAGSSSEPVNNYFEIEVYGK